MGIKKQFLLLMITIMPVAYVSGIVIFDIAAECISEKRSGTVRRRKQSAI